MCGAVGYCQRPRAVATPNLGVPASPTEIAPRQRSNPRHKSLSDTLAHVSALSTLAKRMHPLLLLATAQMIAGVSAQRVLCPPPRCANTPTRLSRYRDTMENLCPVCNKNPLKGKQQACSSACRTAKHRAKQVSETDHSATPSTPPNRQKQRIRPVHTMGFGCRGLGGDLGLLPLPGE